MRKFKNKILTGILLISLGICHSSCSDFFDVSPENGQETSEYYQAMNDVNGAAFGLYVPLAQNVHQLFLWGSARADMVLAGSGANAYISEFVNNRVTVVNPYTNYAFLYQSIARCNHHLEHLPDMKTNEYITAEAMEIFYGEAYFVRALCYYYLVRTFDKAPLVLTDISETVTYTNQQGEEVNMNTLDLSEEELRAIALQPVEQQKIWEAIVSDVNKAVSLLRTNNAWFPPFGDLPEYGVYARASLAAAYTLASEVSLWLGQYERASAMAEYVITYKSVGAAATWASQFTGNGFGTYSTFLFGYQYAQALETNKMQDFTSNISKDGGSYRVKPALEVLENLFSEIKDVRRTSWMMVNREPVIWKYIGKDDKGVSMRDPYQSDASWHVFKAVDGQLLKGIAENRKGNALGALKFLNTVRRNRGLEEYQKEDISLKMEDMEDRLFLEKARETAFEGRRWYDLMLMEKMGRTGVLAEAVSKKYPEAQRQEIKTYLSEPAHWYLPIEPERWSKVED